MPGFKIMWRDIPQLHVKWGFAEMGGIDVVTEQLCEERHMKIPPVLWDNKAKIKDVISFLERRTVPRTRFNLQEILKRYGLKDYDPVAMVRRTHGVSMSDYLWILFDDEEPFKFAKVQLRD